MSQTFVDFVFSTPCQLIAMWLSLFLQKKSMVQRNDCEIPPHDGSVHAPCWRENVWDSSSCSWILVSLVLLLYSRFCWKAWPLSVRLSAYQTQHRCHNKKITLWLEKLHLNQSKLPLIKGKTPDSAAKTTLDFEEGHVHPLHCSHKQAWKPKRQEYFPFLLSPFAETKPQLFVWCKFSQIRGNFQSLSCPLWSLIASVWCSFHLQFSSPGLAKHRRRSTALGSSQQSCKLLRLPWAFQSRHNSPSPDCCVLRPSPSLCKELFPQQQLSAEE